MGLRGPVNLEIPRYYALDCVIGADGRLQVLDVQGGVGGGLNMLAVAYGGKAAARTRLQPYLQRLGEVARGKRVLFVQDLFTAGQTFPDDFFNLVQRFTSYCPITDWVPDLQAYRRRHWENPRAPEVEQMGVFLDPLSKRLKVRIAYCSAARVEYEGSRPRVLLSGYRERARSRPTTVVLSPEEIGVVVFSGLTERFPDDFAEHDWFPLINHPLLDRFFENKWLLPALLEGTRAASLLPGWIPVGMGFRTAEEVQAFAAGLQPSNGFPVAVLKPSNLALSLGVRFLDRTGLRALSARQPRERLPAELALELLAPRVAHSYDELNSYRGKQLDNLLRTPGAEVIDHGDGTFYYSAPYPFLESTVALLQEYVEGPPIRSRRTGRLHRGSVRVVMFDGRVMAALYRLDQEPDDGIFRDISRPGASVFFEDVPPEEERALEEQLAPFIAQLEQEFVARVRSEADLLRLREQWVLSQISPRGPRG